MTKVLDKSKYQGKGRPRKSDYTYTNFAMEIDEHRGNDWIGTILSLIIGMMLGVFIIFALSIVSQIMV